MYLRDGKNTVGQTEMEREEGAFHAWCVHTLFSDGEPGCIYLPVIANI